MRRRTKHDLAAMRSALLEYEASQGRALPYWERSLFLQENFPVLTCDREADQALDAMFGLKGKRIPRRICALIEELAWTETDTDRYGEAPEKGTDAYRFDQLVARAQGIMGQLRDSGTWSPARPRRKS